MSFGKTIKNLRRKHDMTQERLADALSISPQAVSRWETDMAMPDISLIAPLCNLFHVTADELLGIDLNHKDEAVKALCDEAHKYLSRGYFEKAREIFEEGMKRFPDNCNIIDGLMSVAFQQKNRTGDQKYLEETIKLGEKLLSQSTDDHQRHSAIQVLCFSYRDAGRLDEAIKMAEAMPYMVLSQEMLRTPLYTGDEAYRARQNLVANLLNFLSCELRFLQTKLDSGKYAYTADECAILRDKHIALLNLFFENGDFGLYHTDLCDAHRDQAIYYLKKEDCTRALQHLQLAAEYAIKFVTLDKKEHTSLIFRGHGYGSWSAGSSDNEASDFLKQMERPIFDAIRDKEDFIKIKEQLSEHAGKWSV